MNIEECKNYYLELKPCEKWIGSIEPDFFFKFAETLLTAYEEEKEDNKELRKYYATRKEVEELREINKILHDSAENYIHKDKMIAKIEEEDKLFFKTKDVRHAIRYKAYKELLEKE